MTNSNDLAYPLMNNMAINLGLTKREMFAAMAMQGIIASYAGLRENPITEYVAEKSIEFSDALIAELNKPIKIT